jgi:hypothetical protein
MAIEVRNDEREREQLGEGIQNGTTSEYKALFEAASRARSLHIKDARMILKSYWTPKETINEGSAKSAVAAPPAIDTIADEEK